MTGIYAADGSWNVTIVDGSEIVGFYAADGSVNVIASDGTAGPLYDPCGAIRVTLTETDYHRYAPDGSLNVCVDPYFEGPLKVTPVSGSFGATIQLSGLQTIAEDQPIGSAIGTLSVTNGSGTYTFSIVYDPEAKFAINADGETLETSDTLDADLDMSHIVTIEADNGVDTPVQRQFTITVTNVLEVTLVDLSLDVSTIDENSPEDTVVGALQNTASGSTLSLIDTAGNRFKLSGTNIVAGSVSTDYETATSHDITVRETHTDSSNTPHDTVITITVADITEGGGGSGSGEWSSWFWWA